MLKEGVPTFITSSIIIAVTNHVTGYPFTSALGGNPTLKILGVTITQTGPKEIANHKLLIASGGKSPPPPPQIKVICAPYNYS